MAKEVFEIDDFTPVLDKIRADQNLQRNQIEAVSKGLMPEIEKLGSIIGTSIIEKTGQMRGELCTLLSDIQYGELQEINQRVNEWADMKQIPEDHKIREIIINYVRGSVARDIVGDLMLYNIQDKLEAGKNRDDVRN